MAKLISFIVILVIIVGGIFLFRGETSAPTEDELGGNNATTTVKETETPSATTTLAVKEFTVEGSNFAFSPNTMTVKKGDTVRIKFVNKVGIHDWKIDEFKAATKVLQANQSETIEFVADKTGTFEYYCSVGQHRAMGMKGTLTVE